jgi:hypothetical protein
MIRQHYIILASVVERFFVYPLHRKEIDGKFRQPFRMSMYRFSTPVTSFFIHHGSPVTSDQDVELSQSVGSCTMYNMCIAQPKV